MRNEGDVVLAHDERKARAQWTIGVVEKINPSIDNNKLRSVIVRYTKNRAIFRTSRPINKLYLIEYKKHKDERLQNLRHAL